MHRCSVGVGGVWSLLQPVGDYHNQWCFYQLSKGGFGDYYNQVWGLPQPAGDYYNQLGTITTNWGLLQPGLGLLQPVWGLLQPGLGITTTSSQFWGLLQPVWKIQGNTCFLQGK